MARRRAKQHPHPAVIVIAVLHLLGASFGLCIFTFQATGLAERFQEMEQERLQRQNPGMMFIREDELHPELRTMERVELWTSGAFTLMLLAAGIGLLFRQGWARWLSVAYAVLSIGFKIFDTVYVFGFVVPLAQEDPNPDSQVAAQIVIALLVAALGVLYGAAVLIVMLLPSVARSFRRRRVPSFLFADEYDDYAFDDEDDHDGEEDYPRYRRRR